MYKAGDLVVYENMGVCRITDVSEQQLQSAAESRLYYTLVPLYQECVVHTPVDNTKVFMRPVISKDEAESLIDMIPSVQAEPYHNKVVSQLTEHYEASFRTHDCADLIELTMSIYAKRQEAEEQKRKFSVVDEKFMKRAEELLFGELSVAIGIPKDQVNGYIASRVEALGSDNGKTSQQG